MNESLNQNLSENLATFLMGFRDEVIQGIQEYLDATNKMNLNAM